MRRLNQKKSKLFKEILDMLRSEQATKEYMADMHEGGSSKNLLVLTENYSC